MDAANSDTAAKRRSHSQSRNLASASSSSLNNAGSNEPSRALQRNLSKSSVKDFSYPNIHHLSLAETLEQPMQNPSKSQASSSKNSNSSFRGDSQMQNQNQIQSQTNMAVNLQLQVKNFIDDINTHRSKTHFILDSLLNQYNSTLRSYTSASKKLDQIQLLLDEFNNEVSEASKEMSVHAFSSITCRNLGEPIELTTTTLNHIIAAQKEVFKNIKDDILLKIQDKIESDTKYLRQQISLFNSEYRSNVKNFNSCSDKLKAINTKIFSIKSSAATATSSSHQKASSAALSQQTEKLKSEFARHENLAKSLLKFCEDSFENASTEEQRRFNFFHSKQMFMLDEYSSFAIDIVSQAKKLSATLMPPEPEVPEQSYHNNNNTSTSQSHVPNSRSLDRMPSDDRVDQKRGSSAGYREHVPKSRDKEVSMKEMRSSPTSKSRSRHSESSAQNRPRRTKFGWLKI